MAESIANIIDSIHPAASGLGIITSDKIWIIFDREIDENTISAGNFFIAGPDFDTWSGPDLQIYLDRESLGSEEEILQSPGYHGLLQGEISFERISTTNLDVVSTRDTVGSGFLFRTKAIFTPTNRLQADTEYTTYISGDEDDSDTLRTGISSRTVFDPISDPGNTGTAEVDFDGGYIGAAATDTYLIEITDSGEVGTAKFQFSRLSDPLSLFGPFKSKRTGVLLSDGVTAYFGDGVYNSGDKWTVVVRERTTFNGNLSWPFKTGTGSIASVPETTATSVIGDPIPLSTSSSLTTLKVVQTSPADESSNLALAAGEFLIEATFDKPINPSTVASGINVTVNAESVTGEPGILALGTLTSNPTVSGEKLTITVASGELKQNNLVSVTLGSTIEATDGTSLGSDYEFWFTTSYSPMYCASRLMNVKIGAFIQSVKVDTINMAIYVASKEAEALTWNKENLDDEYYQFARGQWTCCRAALMLLTNTVELSGAIKSKKLGDLSVEYNTSSNISYPTKLAEECLARWEGVLMAGGRQVLTPKGVVKGDLDVDKPPIGRGWFHVKGGNQTPITNGKTRQLGSRRFRGTYTPRAWWKK